MTTKPNLDVFYEEHKKHLAFIDSWKTTDDVREEALSGESRMLDEARDAAAKGDVKTLFILLDNTVELAFVADNIAWLKELGQYERALLWAYTDTRINLSCWPLSRLKFLFGLANRPALLAAGDPLPGNGPFTVFRGVAGNGAQRRLRGISWTADKEEAIWFAKRAAMRGLPLPAVYETTVPVERVFAYCNERKEQEFLCDIAKGSKLRRVWKP